MKFPLVATCLFGLEHLLGEEIDALGYERISTIDGRVTFLGDEEAVALSNVFLRYAERVYIKVGSFHAETFDQLFEGTKALPWSDFIGKTDAFPVKGHSIKSGLTSIPDCQSIIKKAVVTSLSKVYGLTVFPEEGVKYQIEFFILNDEATLMIDTSGVPLHKRGYRRESNGAPIRETLAAAIAATARPREDVLFWDPMCGSGTIAVEAAMLVNKIAPGKRRSFAAEQFPFIGKARFDEAREEAIAGELSTKFDVYASDIDPEAVALTIQNAKNAGVNRWIRVMQMDARKIGAPGRRGTVVTNPPYGERLGTVAEAEKLYRDIGRHFRELAPWQIYVITSHEQFEKFYGRRADKVRKLYNGMIPCYLYQYFKNNFDAKPIKK
ncbi:MAG: class I SAM-dependent RNA methyltransferase [Clostridia bacterium]|nr:class I SAM-dependent RNA methyltransferase [Clostridia bacterium]